MDLSTHNLVRVDCESCGRLFEDTTSGSASRKMGVACSTSSAAGRKARTGGKARDGPSIVKVPLRAATGVDG